MLQLLLQFLRLIVQFEATYNLLLVSLTKSERWLAYPTYLPRYIVMKNDAQISSQMASAILLSKVIQQQTVQVRQIELF